MPGYNLSFSYLHNVCINEHIKETWNKEYVGVRILFSPKTGLKMPSMIKIGEITTHGSILLRKVMFPDKLNF